MVFVCVEGFGGVSEGSSEGDESRVCSREDVLLAVVVLSRL